MVRELGRLRGPGEPVYVLAGALPAWAFYSTDWKAPDTLRLALLARIASAGGEGFENAPSRGRPVDHQGQRLTYQTPAGLEIYGIAEGVEVGIFELKKQLPDEGWLANEGGRILAAANPGVWLLLGHFWGTELSLLNLFKACGGRPTHQELAPGAALIRYTFLPSRADGCTLPRPGG